jgi:protein TonB
MAIHVIFAAYAYKAGIFSNEDIDSIPSKKISISLIEPTPPIQPPEPKKIEKRKITTQAPSPKEIAQEPKPVKKTSTPQPEPKVAASPLPSPVKQPNVFTSPQPTYQPKPKYPAIARRRGVEGIVILEIPVATNGHVKNAIIIRSSGSAALDRSALKAINTWQFPASKFNSLAPFKQKIEFRLNQY